VEEVLSSEGTVSLDGPQANYLSAVLRLAPGGQVKLFDNRSGEWLAEIVESTKKRVTLRIAQHLREREQVPDLWLVFAPIKRGRIDWIVEKATELGAGRLVPVITQRTIVDRTKSDRLLAHMIEAAEQCERTVLPELAEPLKLDSLLRHWPQERTLLFADEQGGKPLVESIIPGPAAILIGPEGGFTDEEREAIRSVPQARPVSLGPRILRAETAAIAALSVWMAAAGDWSRHGTR
jgi:16S rRNA (uracil1498-N3)-methyltransferase